MAQAHRRSKPYTAALSSRLRTLWHDLRWRGVTYWVWVLVLVVGGLAAGKWLGERDAWIGIRYRLYQRVAETSARRIEPRFTAIVLIGDQEYWGESLAGRVPINRMYLASVVEAVDRLNPTLLALDFDFRAPNPDGRADHPAYRDETLQLVRAIRAVAVRRPVVLSKTVWYAPGGGYRVEGDVYDEFDLCVPHAKVFCGYLALPRDMRVVPPALPLANGSTLPSLSLAIVQGVSAARGIPIDVEREATLRYGSYIPKKGWIDGNAVVSAKDVLARSPNAQLVTNRATVIGGGWSRFAQGRGDIVDSYPTPVGTLPGVFIHANYAEAILDERTYAPVPGWVVTTVEVILVVFGAGIFAVETRPIVKAGAALASCVLLASISYFLLQNLGRVMDVFIPLVLLAIHAIVHQVLEWRLEAAHARVSITT